MNTENGTKGDLWPKQTKIFGLFLSPLPSRAEVIFRPGLTRFNGVLPLIVQVSTLQLSIPATILSVAVPGHESICLKPHLREK